MNNNSNISKKRILIINALLVVLAIIVGIALGSGKENELEKPYGEVIVEIQNGEVSRITTHKDSHTFWIYYRFIDDKNYQGHYTIVPNIDDFTSFIAEEIKAGKNIGFEVEEGNDAVTAIISLLVSIVPFAFLFYYMNKMMNGNGAKVKPVYSKVRFCDVAGIDEEKMQLQEVVQFLRNPGRYEAIGAKIPKGVLLSGDPGTGKTLLAKAIAGEAGVPFYQVNGSSFEEKFVGVGASRVRKLFAEAKKNAPAIIFIDEIDSVAQKRYGSKANYSEQTLNQLLSEMDGFETSDNVIVIAATNHIEVLDEAICRPGRFDRTVHIPRPDLVAREAILEVHARNKIFANDVSLYDVAKKTTGFCGADLENILNEAAIHAVNHGRKAIYTFDIDEAIARVIAGLKKENAVISDYEKWLTAVHEAGHAIVSRVRRPDVDNFTISIVPRGNAGGYNFFDDADGRYLQKKEIISKLQVLYAGRIAEHMILKEISSGAKSDLEKATQLANTMVTKLAMDDKMLTQIPGEDVFNAELQRIRMEDIERICSEAYTNSKEVITTYLDVVRALAQNLINQETMTYDEINEFFENHGL